MTVQAANITDEDIDAIIQKGQRATEELNLKMKQYTDNAMKFTMDGGIAYEYKDEEDVPEDAPNLKAIAGLHASPATLLLVEADPHWVESCIKCPFLREG